MPDAPIDVLEEAEAALGAITDLLAHITQDDLHCLSPGRLFSLLELVRERIRIAREGLSRRARA